jgi:RNA polymerase sigma factor (sigma-70 family)
VSRLGTYVLRVSGCSTDRPAGSRFGRLGITFCDSVTNAAGPGNDLLMMVSDEELLVASVGDEEAFAAFCRAPCAAAGRFFMRRTGDAELAADLTAETFAAALAARRRFDPVKGAAIGWLYGIARHKLARTLAHGRVEDRARRALGMAPLVLDDDAIELVVTAEGDVVQLLQRLPADQRAAIEARVVDEQEYEQIAAAAQTSEAVIGKRVSRGLASLRRKLKEPTP